MDPKYSIIKGGGGVSELEPPFTWTPSAHCKQYIIW